MTQTYTTEGWGTVIADLTAKRTTAAGHCEQLRVQKRELALDAAMGGTDAKKRLEKVNTELTRLAFEVDDLEVAIAKAEAEKSKQAAIEAEAAERERQAELCKLVEAALRHAEQFTAALRQATAAAAALKLTLSNMLTRATPSERPHLDRLLTPGPFMRTAEYVGLRNHLELAPYVGPQSHIVALEDELAVHLEPWIL